MARPYRPGIDKRPSFGIGRSSSDERHDTEKWNAAHEREPNIAAEHKAASAKEYAKKVARSGGGNDALESDSTSVRPLAIRVGKGNYTGTLGEQFQQLAKDFMWFVDQVGERSVDVMTAALEPTLELSAEYCPKDTGDLVGSRYLSVEYKRGQPGVEIGYARGGNPHYAIIVHEDLTHRHDPPTSAKFLERAIDEDWGNVTQRIVDGYKRLISA